MAVPVILCALLEGVLVEANRTTDRPREDMPYIDYPSRQRPPSHDWRLGKLVHQDWVRSWQAFAKRDFKGAIERLKPLLKKELEPGQVDEVFYAMAYNYRQLANEAHVDNDSEAEIRYLKAAAEIERYPPAQSVDNFQIAQIYRRMGNWKLCATFGEKAFTVKLRWIQFASMKSLIVAECHLKDENIERARFWVTVALKLQEEQGKPIHMAQQWIVDAVESASKTSGSNDE